MTTTQLFESILKDLLDAPESSPRGKKVKELLNYSVVIKNPADRIILSNNRNIKLRYLLAEWVWYLLGIRNCELISKFAPFWKTIADSDNNINSNYGSRIFYNRSGHFPQKNEDYSQYDNVIQTLLNDRDSRQALITINLPLDIEPDNKDVPCTTSIQFLIRDNQLHMIVNMRSNDIIKGFCNDIFQFSMLQELLLTDLNNKLDDKITLGYYYHNAGSMHLYESDYDMAYMIVQHSEQNNNIVNAYHKTVGCMPFMTNLDKIDNYHLLIIMKFVAEHELIPDSLPNESYIKTAYDQLPYYWKNWVDLCWTNKFNKQVK